MQANRIVPTNEQEKKLLQALVAFMGLKTSIVIVCSLGVLLALLSLLSILLTALFTVCQQFAQDYAACNPVEKLIFLVIVWAICAWATRLYRSVKHAI